MTQKNVTKSAGTLGMILLEAGKVTADDLEAILKQQKADGCLFGQAALKLNLVSVEDLNWALAQQFGHPLFQDADIGSGADILVASQPESEAAEAFRSIRAGLMLSNFEGTIKAIAITSVGPEDGRTFTAVNLAVAMAQGNDRTLLVEADYRRPGISTLFNLGMTAGLSTLLVGRSVLTDSIIRGKIHRYLDILPRGPMPPDPSHFLGSKKLNPLMATLRSEYDWIILDTSSMADADTLLIVAACDGALLVTRQGETRLKDLMACKNRLEETGTRFLGAVLGKRPK